MSEKTTVSAVIFTITAALGGYLYWYYSQPKPVPAKTQKTQVAVAKITPQVKRLVETPPPETPLPALADSDGFILDELNALIGNPSLMEYFVSERLIRNIVVTVDNLPSRKLTRNKLPMKPVPGSFFTQGKEGNRIIGPQNARRYAPYVKIAQAIDSKALVELYIKLYPLFQQVYEDLGYPKKYFNDRLVVVLNHLIATPDIQEPVRLVQPKVFYQYADPDLENRSIGQRILMRIGSRNEAIIKAKLREFRQELALHMEEQKIAGTE